MARPLVAHINLSALRHNYRLARQLHGGRALAVVKANAYGHGAVPCAQALSAEADGFAVACIEEALQLRQAGITAPILLLEGIFSADELPLVVAHDLWLVVHHELQYQWLAAYHTDYRFTVWLKMNSGMNRVGFFPADYAEKYHQLTALPQVKKVVLMTHFARADEPDSSASAEQLARFHHICAELPAERSACNSAAVLGVPAAHGDWARPGIMLYGSNPFEQALETTAALQPVMSLRSEVIAVRELPAGEPIGYGARFVTEAPTRVGVVACGYADGYPRVVPTGTPVWVAGQRSRIIGRVSMDMLTIDLTAVPQAQVGSAVELWGEQININEIAAAAGTISYELLCNVKRARFVWQV